MQDNISCALITAFERQYDTSWDDPKLRNERLAMRYGWTAAMEAKQCLHQIQEPAAAEQAAWHAGLDEGRAQEAPAAVAVPDELIRAAKQALTCMDGLQQHLGRAVCQVEADALRAALAATPAMSDFPTLTAAAAPVVLPEPVAWRHSRTYDLHETEDEVQLADGDEYAEPLYTEKQLRAALLAGVSAPAAQAVEPVYTWTGTEADDAMILLGRMDDSLDPERIAQLEQIVPRLGARINALTAQLAAPQAQADARDAKRYRWCREQAEFYPMVLDGTGLLCADLAEAESGIDAAIAAQAAQGGE